MVSVIVPVYNTEEYLEHCAKSILDQTYRDIELILVDDGSTDGSLEICKKIARQDQRVKVYHKENGGQGSARNLGLDVCQGEYICFVDSDDTIHPEMIRILLTNLTETCADISCADVLSSIETVHHDVQHKQVIMKPQVMSEYCRNGKGINQSPVAKLFTRELFNDVKFLELRGFEDAGTIFKLFLRAQKVVHENVVVYYYLQREGSTMHRPFSSKDYDRVIAYKEMEDTLWNENDQKHAATFATTSKIGALFFVAGEATRSSIDEKETLLIQCKKEAIRTLKSGRPISLKNQTLLIMIVLCPALFGLLYSRCH